VAAGDGFVAQLSAVLDVIADIHSSDRGVGPGSPRWRPSSYSAIPSCAPSWVRTRGGCIGSLERLLAASGDEMAAEDLEGLVNMVVAMFTGFSMFGAGPRGPRPAQARGHRGLQNGALAGTLLA